MEKIEGYIERIVYNNPENGYTVFTIAADDEVTCVGCIPPVNEGEYVEVTGEYTNHNLYGEQLKISSFTITAPKDALAMEKYLGSGAIKGIGEPTAKKIVARFGNKTFEIIENEPERLAEIKGISDRKARDIYVQFKEKREGRESMMYLQQFGISQAVAVKIYAQYGSEMKKILESNPYRLAEDIKGIGFRQADEIAYKMGFDADSAFRTRAGIMHTLTLSSNSGNSFLPQDSLYRHACAVLGSEVEDFNNVLDELVMMGKLVIKTYGEVRRVYQASYYYTELSIAKMLIDLNIEDKQSGDRTESGVIAVEKRLGIELDELQKEALYKAAGNALFILTGGPGTGKTTTINAIIDMFEREGLSVLLAAPTGRAAKRMSEATGREARTIHRMLEFAPTGNDLDNQGLAFQKNEDNPLDADVIIIDEASMIDMHLMNALLKAVTIGTRIIFAGDARQLPSVGPGNVLRDIIDSGHFNVVRLTKIFRQAAESDIIVNAHKINEGIYPVFSNKSRDFFMMRRSEAASVMQTVLQLVTDKLPRYVNARPFDIQVLTPMRKGELGVEYLNKILQAGINPPSEGKREKQHGDRVFREGDKVMQVKNDYQLEWKTVNKYGICMDGGMGVFNGDIGTIKEINLFAECLTVVYDDNREVEYSFGILDEIDHAYAVTVHKSQGSEYPAVVIPLLGGPRPLLNRNLLYTAVTRAAKCVTIVGDERVVYTMIENEDDSKRFTGLKDCIVELV